VGAENARELGCAGWRCLVFGGTFGSGVAADLGGRGLSRAAARLSAILRPNSDRDPPWAHPPNACRADWRMGSGSFAFPAMACRRSRAAGVPRFL